MCAILELNGFDVVCAADVPEALKYISTSTFDVLLSDLHMPGAGDGLTVVSAMRHANPKAVTLLLSAFPEMSAAANAILMQADEIMVKPMNIPALIDMIRQRLASGPLRRRVVESVADIMERTAESSIDDWFASILEEETVMAVELSRELRCAHLPQLFRDLVLRLKTFMPLGTKEIRSDAARKHGLLRRHDGRRIAHPAGHHLPDAPEEPAQHRLQHPAARRHDHRRRGRFATEPGDGLLYRRIEVGLAGRLKTWT
jgi:CheY-like chemotaxis protein